MPHPWFKRVLHVLQGRLPQNQSDLRTTRDYIFVDPRLQIEDCRVVLNQPSSENNQIYPSTHFGIFAELKV
jgi:hypothetical protein